MSQPTDDAVAREQQVDAIIAAFLEAADAGLTPDRDEWLARYPDYGVELRAFLDDHDRLRQLTSPLRLATPPKRALADTATLIPGAGATETVSQPPPLGRFGDYELLEEIARGGMGVVFRARQVGLHRIVALKMILTGQLASRGDVQRFHAEAAAAPQPDHPNIAPIYEVGEHAGQHYFSMKLIDGSSLATVRRSSPTGMADQRRAAKLVATVARAVHYAHQRGILHRDLK